MNLSDYFSIAQTLTLIITAIIIYNYTRETQRIREETKRSNDLTIKQINSDVILKLDNNVFNDEFNYLMELIENKILTFNEKEYCFYTNVPYMLFNRQIDKGHPVSPYKMDNLVLGRFEEIGVLCKKGVIDIDFVYEFFDYYIEVCWENNEIQKYIKAENENPKNYKIYSNFEFIYNECRKFEEILKNSSE